MAGCWQGPSRTAVAARICMDKALGTKAGARVVLSAVATVGTSAKQRLLRGEGVERYDAVP